jgi:general secretion pathway protein D
MAKKLSDVLMAEGYSAASSPALSPSVTVIPIPSANAVIVFAADRSILSYAAQWANELDTLPLNRSGMGYYTYVVQKVLLR